MAQSAAANISAAKMVAVTVMAIVKSDMLIATSFCCCLLNRFNGSWFQRSSLSSFSRETGKNVCRAPRSPSLIQKSQLRRLWDEDVATMAESVKDFDRLTFHCARHGFATKMLRDGKDQDGFRIGRLGRYRFAHENLCARNPRCTADQ